VIQEGEGVTIAVARGDVTCPAKALAEWLDAADIETGPIFRAVNKAGTVAVERLADRSVANVAKAYAGRAGFDAAPFLVTPFDRASRLRRRHGRVNLQDDGCFASQVGGYLAAICPRRRTFQGSRGSRAALSCAICLRRITQLRAAPEQFYGYRLTN
jgi:hypothetical protein